MRDDYTISYAPITEHPRIDPKLFAKVFKRALEINEKAIQRMYLEAVRRYAPPPPREPAPGELGFRGWTKWWPKAAP